MSRRAESCGLTLEVGSVPRGWSQVIDRALGEPPRAEAPHRAEVPQPGRDADVVVRLESSREPFEVHGLTPLTRGAFADDRRVVLTDACASGLDLLVEPSSRALSVTARSRPGPSHRALRLVAPGRTEAALACRAPAVPDPVVGRCRGSRAAARLGGAGRRPGCAPRRAGGRGQADVVAGLGPDQGASVSDNLCTYDGAMIHGLREPRRVDAGPVRVGRRSMPHGRVEQPWDGTLPAMTPSLLLVLRRGSGARPTVMPVPPAVAARALATGTYAGGEPAPVLGLRRDAGTGHRPRPGASVDRGRVGAPRPVPPLRRGRPPGTSRDLPRRAVDRAEHTARAERATNPGMQQGRGHDAACGAHHHPVRRRGRRGRRARGGEPAPSCTRALSSSGRVTLSSTSPARAASTWSSCRSRCHEPGPGRQGLPVDLAAAQG